MSETESENPLEPDVYEVGRILGRNVQDPAMLYVQWKGYPDDQVTLEPMANLRGAQKRLRQFQDRELNNGGFIYHTLLGE